jgi:hypothetical protein
LYNQQNHTVLLKKYHVQAFFIVICTPCAAAAASSKPCRQTLPYRTHCLSASAQVPNLPPIQPIPILVPLPAPLPVAALAAAAAAAAAAAPAAASPVYLNLFCLFLLLPQPLLAPAKHIIHTATA